MSEFISILIFNVESMTNFGLRINRKVHVIADHSTEGIDLAFQPRSCRGDDRYKRPVVIPMTKKK
ncbi:hypothetical protein D6_0163 [Aeromonas phage D6]|uniref:Uncharacterized protein n=1 Tax=Aeromonas phage D6 TaxID=2593322 RepID=A0A7G7XLK1_9CAUD|nr:hypothetical protein PQC08_gp112 [Aeromonas phage D6]QNH80846.1 hypothetical protein D6_0163 [Aeromonas phage D6]